MLQLHSANANRNHRHPRRGSAGAAHRARKRVTRFGGLLGLSLLFGCEAPTLGSAAAPLTTYDGPGAPLVWGLPGDAACSFPTTADTAKIDAAVVTFRVLVAPDGSPQAVQTLQEPGFGFGTAATRCAM